MYPVGVLFGLGFDTASSIALLAVTAIAQRGANGEGMPRSHIVILPVSVQSTAKLFVVTHSASLCSFSSQLG